MPAASRTRVHSVIPLAKTRLGEAFIPVLRALPSKSPFFEFWDTSTRGHPGVMAVGIAIGGKSGSGKSTFVNTVVGRRRLFECDAVNVCTRTSQSVFLRAFKRDGLDHGILLTDLPGIADGTRRTDRFFSLYREWVRGSRIFLYLTKMDDRAIEPDVKAVRFCNREKLWVAISQVDRAPPHRDWIVAERRPSKEQAILIDMRVRMMARRLEVPVRKVIPCSAAEGYNLDALLASMARDVARLGRVPGWRRLGDVGRGH